MHHKHFDCNYGAMHIPIDWWVGTFAAEKADIAGRLYLAAMCVLVLETPYRHVSVYEVTDPEAEREPVTEDAAADRPGCR